MGLTSQAVERLEVGSDNAKAGDALWGDVVVAESKVVLDSVGILAPDILPVGASVGDAWDRRAVARSWPQVSRLFALI